MSVPQLPDSIIASLNTASATVTAATIAATIALIAAALSLIGVLVSATIAKRNGMITARTAQQVKHADFRQNWINKLREQMALFQAKAFEDPVKAGSNPDVGEAMLMILMLIDRKDPHYTELKQLMYQVTNFTKAPRDPGNPYTEEPDPRHLPDNPIYTTHARFVEVCQDILKSEWEVTKKGLYSLESYFEEQQQIETVAKVGWLRLGRAPKPRRVKADEVSIINAVSPPTPTPVQPS
jgi:hypothetical protein